MESQNKNDFFPLTKVPMIFLLLSFQLKKDSKNESSICIFFFEGSFIYEIIIKMIKVYKWIFHIY